MEIYFVLWACVPWLISYAAAAYVGFRDHTYGMPAICIALNLAWECIFFISYLPQGLCWQTVLYGCWIFLEIGIVGTFLHNGRKELSWRMKDADFLAICSVAFVLSCGLWLIFLYNLPLKATEYLSAYMLTTFISILYIRMFIKRRGPRGQSLFVSTMRLMGNAGLMTGAGFWGGDPAGIVFGLIFCSLDVVHIGLLYWAKKDPVRWNGTRKNA